MTSAVTADKRHYCIRGIRRGVLEGEGLESAICCWSNLCPKTDRSASQLRYYFFLRLVIVWFV